MRDTSDWILVSAAAAQAKRAPATIRRAAQSGALGPLAVREEGPTGPFWLVHPLLADPEIYRDVIGVCGRERAEERETVGLLLELLVRAENRGTQHEVAHAIRAVRVGSPVVQDRILKALGRLQRDHADLSEVDDRIWEYMRRTYGYRPAADGADDEDAGER